jgi:hypothetical protein
MSKLVNDFKPCDKAGDKMEIRLPFIERFLKPVIGGILPAK